MAQQEMQQQPLLNTSIQKAGVEQTLVDENKLNILKLWDGYLGFSQYKWNAFFAFLCVSGQVIQNVTLPLWFASVPPPGMDPLFILTFAGLSFCIIFAVLTLLDVYNGKTSFAECKQFTTKSFIIRYCAVGIADALNGIFLVFAANPNRTPAGIQSILTILTIFWTILFRFVILRKLPNTKQAIYACVTFFGLFMASIPTVFGMVDSGPFKSNANGIWKWLWPVIFGASFAPAAVMNVVGENILQQKKETGHNDANVNIWYFLTWESVVQELTFIILFWMDCLPNFGTQNNTSDIFSALKQCWRWFFGLDGAHWYYSTIRAVVFVFGYTFSYIGTSLMLRYTEGATWAAIASALVTPIGTIFWFFFYQQDVKLIGQWSWDTSNWYILLGVAIISPAMYAYHLESKRKR
eukprot:75570_1